MFGRNRFGDLIARQLDLFGEENRDLLFEIAEYRERLMSKSSNAAYSIMRNVVRQAKSEPKRR